jgi:hypothetical protein
MEVRGAPIMGYPERAYGLFIERIFGANYLTRFHHFAL